MNVEELRALFSGETARLKTIVNRLDEIDGELEKLRSRCGTQEDTK